MGLEEFRLRSRGGLTARRGAARSTLLSVAWKARHNSETSAFRDYESLRGREPVASSLPLCA